MAESSDVLLRVLLEGNGEDASAQVQQPTQVAPPSLMEDMQAALVAVRDAVDGVNETMASVLRVAESVRDLAQSRLSTEATLIEVRDAIRNWRPAAETASGVDGAVGPSADQSSQGGGQTAIPTAPREPTPKEFAQSVVDDLFAAVRERRTAREAAREAASVASSAAEAVPVSEAASVATGAAEVVPAALATLLAPEALPVLALFGVLATTVVGIHSLRDAATAAAAAIGEVTEMAGEYSAAVSSATGFAERETELAKRRNALQAEDEIVPYVAAKNRLDNAMLDLKTAVVETLLPVLVPFIELAAGFIAGATAFITLATTVFELTIGIIPGLGSLVAIWNRPGAEGNDLLDEEIDRFLNPGANAGDVLGNKKGGRR